MNKVEAYVKVKNGIVWNWNLPEALVGVHLLHWIATYPVDKVIHSLNNWGLHINFKPNISAGADQLRKLIEGLRT